jgi:iron complex transport system substrate-binding protein
MKTINKLMLIPFLSIFLIFVSCSSLVEENFSEKPKPIENENTKGQQKENELSIMLSEIEEIIDPNNISWPRIVKINDLEIVIYDRPKRITTVSLGHDEILFGISNNDQIVGTTSFAQEEGSNIKNKAKGLPTVSNDPESIIVLDPDIVFADPFTSMELIDALEDFGIKVIQTNLNNSIEGRKKDILLMSYMTGNLSEAAKLINLVERNVEILENFAKENKELPKKVMTLSWWDAYWTSGKGSTEDSIISLAGAINLSALNGIESNSTIDKELLIAMNPEIILITQSVDWGGNDFYNQLFNDNSLTNIDAIKNNEVYMVNPNWWSTLSYWNTKGSEELAKILWDLQEIPYFKDYK